MKARLLWSVMKSRAVGWTDGSSFRCSLAVTMDQPEGEVVTLFELPDDVRREIGLREFSVKVGEGAFVCFPKNQITQFDKALDLRVLAQGFPPVIDLTPGVADSWVGQKQDARDGQAAAGDVGQFAVRALPYAMKLGFDHHFGPFPDRPAEEAFAAFAGYPVGHDVKALVEWGARRGGGLEVLRAVLRGDRAAEGCDVGLDEFGRSHG